MNNNINNISNYMGNNYKRVVNNGSGFRGFKLNIRKLSIQRLKVKFMSFFRRWKKTYERAVGSLRLGRRSRSRSFQKNNNSYSYLIGGDRKSTDECKRLTRTNSFYSEAIADCLEFIKRNSLSLDDHDHIDASIR